MLHDAPAYSICIFVVLLWILTGGFSFTGWWFCQSKWLVFYWYIAFHYELPVHFLKVAVWYNICSHFLYVFIIWSFSCPSCQPCSICMFPLTMVISFLSQLGTSLTQFLNLSTDWLVTEWGYKGYLLCNLLLLCFWICHPL